MDCSGNQESKSEATSSLFSHVENIWTDFPPSSLADALPTSHSDMEQCDNLEEHALPSSDRGMVEVEFNNHLEARALPLSSYVHDQTAVVHATNPSAMQFGCLPPSGRQVAHSSMHAIHAEMHIPYSLSTMEGSSVSGSAASHALCYSNVSFSSGNDVAHVTLDLAHVAPLPNSCLPKASTSTRLEFMQRFVNTLLPELKKIHSQSPPISLKEKRSAVRLAADMSLAISAGGNNTWSQALLQELASSSGTKVGVRRKNNVRKSNILRGRIYASILRRSSLRGGGAHASHSKGSSSFACLSILRESPSTQGPLHFKTGCGVCQMRQRTVLKRRSGLVSYVKILKNSRPTKRVKSAAVSCNEASKAYAQPTSKEHIASLGRLVPGGRNMDVPLLFQEAADYILSLQMQVEALQSLSHFVS